MRIRRPSTVGQRNLEQLCPGSASRGWQAQTDPQIKGTAGLNRVLIRWDAPSTLPEDKMEWLTKFCPSHVCWRFDWNRTHGPVLRVGIFFSPVSLLFPGFFHSRKQSLPAPSAGLLCPVNAWADFSAETSQDRCMDSLLNASNSPCSS